MSEFEWVETRTRAIELFRDAPSASQEQRVLDVFREHPALVVEAVEHVGRRLASGQVRNPWAILAKHVEDAMRPLEDVTATDERDRDKAVSRAEQWIRTAGKHYDSPDEIIDELFGATAQLSVRLFDSPDLRQRMLLVWREARPEGELIAEQGEMRARAYVSANGQVTGERGLPVTRLPWKVPVSALRRDDDPEPQPIDRDPEPVAVEA